MSRVLQPSLKATLYDIVTSPDCDRLHESFKNRRPFRMWLFNHQAGRRFQVTLKLTGIDLHPNNPERFNYKAIVMPAGRWIRVEGVFMYDAPGRRGTMQVVPQKHCSKCNIIALTFDARCDRCGNELRTHDIQLLDSSDPD